MRVDRELVAYDPRVAGQGQTFDEVAALYDEVRPQVLETAVEALWRGLQLAAGDAVVEVGCGSGQLTRHLVERGAAVTALEPGRELGRICGARFGAQVTVLECSFEQWSPDGRRYRAVAARQAAHWIEPTTFLDRCAEVLSPAGRIGLLWYLDRSQDTPFWQATNPLYERYLPDAPNKPPRTIPALIAGYQRALEQDPRYSAQPLERWAWSRDFDEAGYLRLLETNSPVRMLTDPDRAAFLAGHADIIRSQGDRVTRHYQSVLLLAHGRSG